MTSSTRNAKGLKQIVAHARMSNFILKEDASKLTDNEDNHDSQLEINPNMMRSMKTASGGASYFEEMPIIEKLSVESASDDNETYEMRFKKRGNALFKDMLKIDS